MLFTGFPKMARFSRECVITEKIDGTNAQIAIGEPLTNETQLIAKSGSLGMWAGSRTRWITPEKDNFGFAQFVKDNAEELFKLGIGRHYGEWWGAGIQRKYGFKQEKFLSLFNVKQWNKDNIPSCCSVVPILYEGVFSEYAISVALCELERGGSKAAPGFMDPEGIIIYHIAAGMCFKKTIKDDESPKGHR